MRDLRALPKVDLHVHLEGCMRLATLTELADRYGAPLPDHLDGDTYRFNDFSEFIATWIAITDCLRAPDDLRRLALEFCEDMAMENVRYAEAHFSLPRHDPQAGDYETRLLAVLDGLAAGRQTYGVDVALILDLVRGLSFQQSAAVVDCAIGVGDERVVAFGLGGPEEFGPASYLELFDRGRDAGMHCVVHAGETQGPRSITAALAVGAERIGHGINVLADPGVVAVLRERAIALEVCPTSNAKTASVASLDVHPLPELVAQGLVVTLNSDDPALFASPLTGEYELCRDLFGLDDEALVAIARAGVAASFAADDVKATTVQAIDGWLAG